MKYRKVTPRDVAVQAVQQYALDAEAKAFGAETELARVLDLPEELAVPEDVVRNVRMQAKEARRDAQTWAAGLGLDEAQIREAHLRVLHNAVEGVEREHACLEAARDFKLKHEMTVTEQGRIDILDHAHRVYTELLDALEAEEDEIRNAEERPRPSRAVKRAVKRAPAKKKVAGRSGGASPRQK